MKAKSNTILLLSILITACTSASHKSFVEKDELINMVNNKSTGIYSKTINGIKYAIQYKPSDYMALQEMQDKTLDNNELKKLIEEYNKYEYYTFEISIDGFTDEILKYQLKTTDEYTERLNYYAFKFQNDINLIQETDTLTTVNYHFERNYGLAPNVKFLLAFKRADDSKDRTFVCNEKYLGSGIVKINITPDDLKEIPKLKIN